MRPWAGVRSAAIGVFLTVGAVLLAGCQITSTAKQAAPDPGGSGASASGGPTITPTVTTPDPPVVPKLPDGSTKIFPGHILVAYYGTSGTGSLGVLGEASPDAITERLRKAAAPFAQGGRKVQIVYELIVTVADGFPGPDGNYSHDISHADVQRYIQAAKRNNALLVLDLQPGRSDFLSVAKRWDWALKNPWVGLALDPEWHMPPGEIPAQQIGTVDAAGINRVADYLAALTRQNHLPQKLFMLHQFTPAMITHIGRVHRHDDLAEVQHVDGFGPRANKLGTYHRVARPGRFHMGFKLFYDEDTDMFSPKDLLKVLPQVQFVSYQ
ncbi:MAG: hypothetical protein ACR2KG_04585 [Nocardioidaceae bacterium]